MNKHAFLSASASHRWLNCPPSAKLCADTPDQSNSYAEEGTCAHDLCVHKLEKALGRDTKDPTENLSYYDSEMENCAEEYCAFCMEQIAEVKKNCKSPLIMVEQRVSYDKWVPNGYGTADFICIGEKELLITDFKYGLGVLVDATKNSQLMCYALGALDCYGFLYDIETVTMTIFQPRRENVSSYTMNVADLLKWADEVLAPTALLALEGKGEFKAGDHCTFCKVKATCRKRCEHNLELAKYDFEMPSTLDTIEIASILPLIDELVSWGNDVKEFALQQALSGVEYPGFKIVEGRSKRAFTNTTAVALAVENAGYDPYEKKLLGITAMTSLLGKAKFNTLLGSYITKAPGKPTLVSENDKRTAMNTAAEDFKEN